jgi:dipeptidyl aminopeptidase/acylaminoacyl peptidase
MRPISLAITAFFFSLSATLAWAEEPASMQRLNIPYRASSSVTGKNIENLCKLDVYLPPPPAKDFPIVVWLHGGGLSGGDKSAAPEAAAALRLAANGIAVVSANYRLSPHVTFPAYIEDSAQAVRWTIDHARELGADPKKIYVSGYSAGGYIAAMLALDEHFLRDAGVTNEVSGFICISGQMTTHFTVRDETGLQKNTVIVNSASPLFHVRPGSPRLLLLVGDNDFPARLEENQFLAAALHKVAGNPSAPVIVVKDRTHATMLSRFLETGDPAGSAVLNFIDN